MRLSVAAALAAVVLAPCAGAQTFAPDDVSILLAPPRDGGSPVLALPETSLSAATAAAAAAVVATFGKVGDVSVDPELLGGDTGRGDTGRLAVASLRLDPGAPGLGPAFAPFGRQPQLRLVVQPTPYEGGVAIVQDQAIHLVYSFERPPAAPSACPFAAEPDMPAFAAAVDDLVVLKAKLAAAGVITDGAPLGVHPAFANEATADLLIDGLGAFLRKNATEARLTALSVAGIPAGAPEPWVFMAMTRDPATGEIRPVPGPAIPQAPGAPSFAQMIDFRGGGAVEPPALTRNLLPVDCLANFLGIPAPAPGDGVTTTTLFAAGANTPEAAAAVAAVVADTARAHFFNTDCVSCHTETRRQIDAAGDRAAMAAASDAIAAAEGIDPAAMPRSPADSNPDFDQWNVRAFGWFPGIAPAGARAQATVARRTARETADVVACLNSGRWNDPSQPCLPVVAQAAEAEAPASGAAPAGETPVAGEPTVAGAAPPAEAEVVQGWGPLIRAQFYHSSQGSSLMPARYFAALERADGQGRFAAPENLARYGFLASDNASGLNPLDLPVGLALTRDGDVGLNCAACHTADVILGGERRRIDGAPAALDFDSFLADLAAAVQATVQLDPTTRPPNPTSQFAAFLTEAGEPDPGRALAVAADFLGGAALRRPAHPSGPGRVDALTQIVNSLAVADLGVPDNLRTPAAPTSYPALWLAPQLEFVQWNLSAADPLPRNIGQAQGVFGRTDLKTAPPSFATSADLETLLAYEAWLRQLEPPRWPETLRIDPALAREGQALFIRECEGCHNAPPFRMSDPAETTRGEPYIKVGAVPLAKVGTDPLYTQALGARLVETAGLAPVFGAPVVPALDFFRGVVGQTTVGLLKGAGVEPARELRMRPAGHKDCEGGDPAKPCGYEIPFKGGALKAGPLMGVWATGPYLHNGSVRTVYEVISPPAERAATFWIGDRTIDETRLGFADTEGPGAFLFDASLPGNSAQGHDFWREKPLTHEERMAIIEYLKDPQALPVPRP